MIHLCGIFIIFTFQATKISSWHQSQGRLVNFKLVYSSSNECLNHPWGRINNLLLKRQQLFLKLHALSTMSDKSDYWGSWSIHLNLQSTVSNSMGKTIPTTTAVPDQAGSTSLSCSELRYKPYLFPNQNKSLNVQLDTNCKRFYKRSKGSLRVYWRKGRDI